MTSRRDQFLGNISLAGESLQRGLSELAAANPQSTAARPTRQRAQSQTSQTSTNSSGLPSFARTLSRGVGGLERGLTSLLTESSHLARPLPNGGRSPTTSWDDPNPAASSPPNSHFPPPPGLPAEDQRPDGDRLPNYARRDPRSSRIATREFCYQSKSGKVEVTVNAAGAESANHPVFVHDLLRHVTGNVTVRLDKPEPVTLIRIRLKCVINSCIFVQRGTGRHPMVDELVLFDEGQTLWQAPTEDARVHGTRSFPFSIAIPQTLQLTGQAALLYNQSDQIVKPPPSFMMGGNAAMQESASVKYYLKVTLARQGLLRPNERLFVPIIYLAHHESNPILESRAEQFLEGNPLRGPNEDPSGWFGKRSKTLIRGGSLARSRQNATYECIALLPTPAIYDRHSPIQYALRLKSTDPNVTSRFPVECITVALIQQAIVTVASASSMFDNEVKTGQTMCEDGLNGVDFPSPDKEGFIWSKTFSGSLDLPVIPPSFTAPRLLVGYVMAFTIRGPGSGNNMYFQVPIKIYSTSPPVQRHQLQEQARQVPRPPVREEGEVIVEPEGQQQSANDTQSDSFQSELESDLPPSYFQAISGESNSNQDIGTRRAPIDV